jgi:dienelactone hydrolase
MPRQWNQSLVLAAGGYSPAPVVFDSDEAPDSFVTEILRQGYAYVETGYSVGGVALTEAISDVRALRDHFVRMRAKPRRTFIVGESKGGLVALTLVESSPGDFDGGLAISGLLSSPYAFFSRAYDLLVAYEKLFPRVLPSPKQIPHSYAATPQAVTAVLRTLDGDSISAQDVRKHAGTRTNEELAELLVFHTEAMGELQRRCAGNPFQSAPLGGNSAEACVRAMVAPTGMLQRPFIALGVTYDPIIPRWSGEDYLKLVSRTGKNEYFVNRIVSGEGHLNVSAPDRIRAFNDLVQWSTTSIKPS